MKIQAQSIAQTNEQFIPVQNKPSNSKEINDKLLAKNLPDSQNLKAKVGDDAVRVKLSEHLRDNTSLSRPEAYNRARKLTRANRSEKPDSVFTPGKPIVGKYADGKFKTHSGFEGSYHGLPGGQIGFEVGGFQGILAPSGKAIAVNPETGETFTMEVKYRNGYFKVNSVREVNPRSLNNGNNEPLIVEKKAENVSLRYDDAGKLAVKIKNPETGETLSGQGYLGPQGIYTLALDNGATIFGTYQFGEDGLEIFNRQALN